jgi:soluble P-type ATPase
MLHQLLNWSLRGIIVIEIDIPGYGHLHLLKAIVDFNGTLAQSGVLIEGVKSQLIDLAKRMEIHVVTGNTYGTAEDQLRDLPCRVVMLPSHGQALAKREIVEQLGPDMSVAVGNGRNDVQMMQSAALAIAVMGKEGVARDAVMVADVITGDIHTALNMLQYPQRLVATLRC